MLCNSKATRDNAANSRLRSPGGEIELISNDAMHRQIKSSENMTRGPTCNERLAWEQRSDPPGSLRPSPGFKFKATVLWCRIERHPSRVQKLEQDGQSRPGVRGHPSRSSNWDGSLQASRYPSHSFGLARRAVAARPTSSSLSAAAGAESC